MDPRSLSRRAFLGGVPAGSALLLGGWRPAGGQDDRGYLVKGLTGLGRTCDRPGWFQAHWGGAVLAAYYLLQEKSLGDRIKAAIRAEADLVIAKYAPYFAPYEGERSEPKRIDEVAAVLEGPITGHRASGHHVIFAALGLRALAEAPELAYPSLVRGLCRITERIGAIKAAPDTPYNRANPLPAYTDEASLAEALFGCIARFEGAAFGGEKGEGGPARPNFTHQITFTEALIQLQRSGRKALAERGYPAHRIYVNEAPPGKAEKQERHPQARLEVVLSPEFWEEETNRRAWKGDFDIKTNRMGDWVVGHLFKVLYSYLQVRALVRDPELVRKVDGIVLERYVDPKAAGG